MADGGPMADGYTHELSRGYRPFSVCYRPLHSASHRRMTSTTTFVARFPAVVLGCPGLRAPRALCRVDRLAARRLRRHVVCVGAGDADWRIRSEQSHGRAARLPHAHRVRVWRHPLRRHRRSLRTAARVDGQPARVLRLHVRVRARRRRSGNWVCSDSCWGWAWEASGRAARRSCPRRGPTPTGPRRWA